MKKRAFERVPVNMQGSLFFGNSMHKGTVTNLSKNGMYISTRMCPPVKSRLNVLVPLKEGTLEVPVKVCRIVRTGAFCEGVGVELLRIPGNYLEMVNTLTWNSVKDERTRRMMKNTYVCGSCRHVVFDHMPIVCPICASSIENFEHDPRALRMPADPENLTDEEKEHTPLIQVGKTSGEGKSGNEIDVHIRVGLIRHLMNLEHYISFVDFYISDHYYSKRSLGRLSMNLQKMKPAATICLDEALSGTLTVISNCSNHGRWMAEASL